MRQEKGCEGPGEFPNEWFLYACNKLRSIGSDLVLIDAGDYDGDGVSEVLFRIGGIGDTEYGYYLFCPRTGSTHEFRIPGDPH